VVKDEKRALRKEERDILIEAEKEKIEAQYQSELNSINESDRTPELKKIDKQILLFEKQNQIQTMIIIVYNNTQGGRKTKKNKRNHKHKTRHRRKTKKR